MVELSLCCILLLLNRYTEFMEESKFMKIGHGKNTRRVKITQSSQSPLYSAYI